MRISDWSSDVCSSDLARNAGVIVAQIGLAVRPRREDAEIALAPACQPAEQIIIILGVAPARIFAGARNREPVLEVERPPRAQIDRPRNARDGVVQIGGLVDDDRSEEHTSELQSLMRISYAVFCLKKKNNIQISQTRNHMKN